MGMLILKRDYGLHDRTIPTVFLWELIIYSMMNKPNQRSAQSPSIVIPYQTMDQQNIPNTMPHSSRIEHRSRDISHDILKTILEKQKDNCLLSDLAEKIGISLKAEACIIVSTMNNDTSREINYWEDNHNLWSSKILDELSDLRLNPNGLSSDILKQVDNLLKKVLPSINWLGTTTQNQHQVNGLILLLRSDASPWSHSEQKLLTLISDSMSIAISQTQLQQQSNNKSKYHSLLKNLSREVSCTRHPDLLFKNCLTEVCETLSLDRGMILMLKYQNPLQAKSKNTDKSVRGTVEIACHWDAHTNVHTQDKQLFPFSYSALCQQGWQTAPNRLCFDSGTPFPDLDPPDDSISLKSQGEALLMVPLMGKKISETSPAAVWGFLVLQHDSPRQWAEDELDLVDWIGVQISTAIVHHQTLNQVQSIVDERTAQLKWSLDVQAKLSEKMRQHIEQLQRLNQLKDDFMNSMSHELKTPLTSMKMAIMMLRQSQISPEMREKYLNILEQEWNREYGLIKDLLTLQELESGQLAYSPEELDLARTINNLLESLQDKFSTHQNLKIETNISESDLKINTDADSLTNVLKELLVNAGKYSAANTTIKVSVENQATFKGKYIVIAIANYGAGITPEELPHIFDKFRRGAGVTDRAVPGTGLGLTLVKNLVDHLNGTINVTSEPIEDDADLHLTTFILELPQFQPPIS